MLSVIILNVDMLNVCTFLVTDEGLGSIFKAFYGRKL
jgi:hypothetical protein